MVVSARRSRWSTSQPAGANSATTGTTWTSPTRPSVRVERVRSYSSQPTATETICRPKAFSARAAAIWRTLLPIAAALVAHHSLDHALARLGDLGLLAGAVRTVLAELLLLPGDGHGHQGVDLFL